MAKQSRRSAVKPQPVVRHPLRVILGYGSRRGWDVELDAFSDQDAAADLRQLLQEGIQQALATLPVAGPDREECYLLIQAELPESTADWPTRPFRTAAQRLVESALRYEAQWQRSQSKGFVLSVKFLRMRLPVAPDQPTIAGLENEQPQRLPAIEQVHAELEQLNLALDQFRRPLRERFQAALLALAGKSLGSYEANAKLVKQLNQTRRLLGCAFRIGTDELSRRVNLRCIKPPGSREGSFQVVSTLATQEVLYTGLTLPYLVAFDPTDPN